MQIQEFYTVIRTLLQQRFEYLQLCSVMCTFEFMYVVQGKGAVHSVEEHWPCFLYVKLMWNCFALVFGRCHVMVLNLCL